jgi:hypothetical protein
MNYNNDDDNNQKYKNEQERFNEFLKDQLGEDIKGTINKAQESVNEMPLYMQFFTAFSSSNRYMQLLWMRWGKVIGYFFFMTFIAALLAVAVPIAGRIVGVGGIGTFISERIPNFTYSNGVLEADSTMQYDKEGIQFYLDTSVNSYKESDIDKESFTQILVSKSNMLVYQGGAVMKRDFSELPEFTFSKQMLLDNVGVIYAIIIFAGFIRYISLMFTALFTMLMLSAIGFMLISLNKLNVKFTDMLKLSVYAVTIVTIIEAFNTAIPIVSPLIANIIGLVWAAGVYYKAVIKCGMIKRVFGNL